MSKTLTIGLTGGIASGKTTVSTHFATWGVPIIDADVIAHALTQAGQTAVITIAEVFGQAMLQTDGSLNRQKLRQYVFQDKGKRKQLEAILHPLIRAEMHKQATAVTFPYCVFSIPLLVETRQTNYVDRVLVVDCPTTLQHQRLVSRNGFNANEIAQILAAQASRSARLAQADDVIHNDTSPTHLIEQVLRFHHYYQQLACEISTKP
ncbi:dephospho-CoA kinase [Beggiatoa leptomitoformis]|uniref:dephospho-CoA kinase n=1 Tax=Beggiatoa leptomitoformis TaxID=288004 RepID=UPI00078442CC|nr:dephospho-CoA kinase [Beggiatoa leptomitoformis]